MLTKTQLQQEVQNLESKLQEFREQLNSHKEVTIETASVGDTLEDGSIVVKKENGLALLVAPKSTQVEAKWSKEFSEVFEALKSQGFNPSQWFIPTKEQLLLAYRNVPNEFSSTRYWSSTECNVPNEFSSTRYWSSTECNATLTCFVPFIDGGAYNGYKTNVNCVRAFRCVTY